MKLSLNSKNLIRVLVSNIISTTALLSISSCNSATAASVSSKLPCDSSLKMRVTSSSIASVQNYASLTSCSVPANEVCVAFDIDNTLITNDPNFGGEAWSNWQKSLFKTDHDNPNLLTTWLTNVNYQRAEGGVRFLMNYNIVESITASTVASLQQQYQTIAISSRSFSGMATAERQLAANNINMSINPIGDHKFDNTFFQQSKSNGDLKMYYNGIYYVAEESKGETLIDLINYYRVKMNNSNLCKVIIFLDDSPNKVTDVSTKLNANGKIGYIAIDYTALPQASESVNWYPNLWEDQSVELQNVICKFNKDVGNPKCL